MITILKFEADWCRPCQEIKPIIRDLVEDFENVTLKEIDVVNSPELAAQYNVRNIPYLVFEKDGSFLGKSVGAKTKDEYAKLLVEYGGYSEKYT